MSETDAADEASSRASVSETKASRISISEVDPAYLSNVSRELEERVVNLA